MPENTHILLIEDNPVDQGLVEEYLSDTHFNANKFTVVDNLKAGLSELTKGETDVILLDLSLPDSFGLKGLNSIRGKYPQLPVIILTGLQDNEVALEAIKNGAQDYLVKDKLDAYTLEKGIGYSIERIRTEQQIRENETRYRQLIQTMNEGLVYVDNEDCIIFVNTHFCDMMGYAIEEVVGKKSVEILNTDEEGYEQLLLNNKMRSQGKPSQYEIECKKKNGTTIWLLGNGSSIYNDKKEIIGSLAVFSDITLRKKQNIDYMNFILEAQEKERKRIAQDLHDGLGQSLSGLKLNLRNVSKFDETLGKHLVKIMEEIIAEYRSISHNLTPPLLSQLGLSNALREICSRLNKASAFDVTYNETGKYQRLPLKVEIEIFRMAQEMINNAIKYAEPQSILITLNSKGEYICLMVEDDGKGFDIKEAEAKDGIGLRNIKMRTKMLKGKLHINSKTGNGTSIELCVSKNIKHLKKSYVNN